MKNFHESEAGMVRALGFPHCVFYTAGAHFRDGWHELLYRYGARAERRRAGEVRHGRVPEHLHRLVRILLHVHERRRRQLGGVNVPEPQLHRNRRLRQRAVRFAHLTRNAGRAGSSATDEANLNRMPRPVSAGALLYRHREGTLEVLLVHPSGPYNKRAPYSIPKGLLDPGEDAEQAARREVEEETGVTPGALSPIGSIDYKKSRKTVVAFAGPAPEDAEPRCASWEVDCAEFLPLHRARELIHRDQLPFLERLPPVVESPPSQAQSRV